MTRKMRGIIMADEKMIDRAEHVTVYIHITVFLLY